MSNFVIPKIRDTKAMCYKFEALDDVFEHIDQMIDVYKKNAQETRESIDRQLKTSEEEGNPVPDDEFGWRFSYEIDRIQNYEQKANAFAEFRAVLSKKYMD